MELDRGDIERRDFPMVRRGYDPSAVDAHLREIAAAVERLHDHVEELSARPESLSQTANERLRRILEAAEASANEISAEAEEEARAVTVDARREAQSIRDEAQTHAEDARREARGIVEEAENRARERDAESETATAEGLSRVDKRTAELMLRADTLDQEYDQLLARMRAAGEAAVATLRDEAAGLRDELDEMPGEAVSARPSQPGAARPEALETPPGEPELPPAGVTDRPTAVVEPAEPEPLGDEGDDVFEPGPEAVDTERDEQVEPLGDEVIPEPQGGEPLPEPSAGTRGVADEEAESEPTIADDEPSELPTSEDQSGAEPDTEGARLIALNMALSGSSRGETADYLRETFGIEDRALLDDVYERVQAS